MFQFCKRYIFALSFVSMLFCIFIISNVLQFSLLDLGVYPLKIKGLLGIFTAPLVHSSYSHLISNASALVILLYILFAIFRKVSYLVFICGYIIPGIITWFIGRQSIHIGASGLVYALITFILLIGFFTKKREILALSFIVLVLHGGFIWGIFPMQEEVSWEYHFGGFITGFFLAIFFKDFSFTEEENETDAMSNQSATAQNIEFIYSQTDTKEKA